jgi:hypothetical protein
MLTYAQVQTVAFTTENGTVHHYACACREFGELTVQKADAGLTNTGPGLRPLIQYSLDEWISQDVYERAEERASDFEYDHPVLARLFGVSTDAGPPGELDKYSGNRWRLLDRLAERYEDIAGPTCDTCGEPIR